MAGRIAITRKAYEEAQANTRAVEKDNAARLKKAKAAEQEAADRYDLEVGRALRRQGGKPEQGTAAVGPVPQEEPAEAPAPVTAGSGSGWSRLGNGVR